MLDSFRSQERQFIGKAGEREWSDYKRFAFRDDMLKLTVGLTLGNSFNKAIQSLSNNLVVPALSFATLNAGESWRGWSWSPVVGLELKIGQLAGDMFDFVVVSVVLYLIYVKLAGGSYEMASGAKPCARRCGLCLECVHPDAVRCRFCGGRPDGVKRGDGVKDKGAKDCGGEQNRPVRPKRQDSNRPQDAGESDSGTGGGRRRPRPKRGS